MAVSEHAHRPKPSIRFPPCFKRYHPQRCRYTLRQFNPVIQPLQPDIPASSAAFSRRIAIFRRLSDIEIGGAGDAVAPKVQTEGGKRKSKLPVEAVTVQVSRLSRLCGASVLRAGYFHDVPHNFLVERRKAVDGRWQQFGPGENHA